MSCVLRKSSAACGDDTTIVGTWPCFRDIIGPYFLARFWRPRCGRAVNMGRFPMIGSSRGPGRRFLPFLWWLWPENRRSDDREPRMTRKTAKIIGRDIVFLCQVCLQRTCRFFKLTMFHLVGFLRFP